MIVTRLSLGGKSKTLPKRDQGNHQFIKTKDYKQRITNKVTSGSDSGSASGSAAGSSTELEGGARGAGSDGWELLLQTLILSFFMFTENLDPSKVRLPKSTVNLRHQTDNHFKSDT